jgi:hypothetical protein
MSASYCASWGDYASFFGLELRSGKADRSIGSSGGRSPRSDCTTEYEAKERAAALANYIPWNYGSDRSELPASRQSIED